MGNLHSAILLSAKDMQEYVGLMGKVWRSVVSRRTLRGHLRRASAMLAGPCKNEAFGSSTRVAVFRMLERAQVLRV